LVCFLCVGEILDEKKILESVLIEMREKENRFVGVDEKKEKEIENEAWIWIWMMMMMNW